MALGICREDDGYERVNDYYARDRKEKTDRFETTNVSYVGQRTSGLEAANEIVLKQHEMEPCRKRRGS